MYAYLYMHTRDSTYVSVVLRICIHEFYVYCHYYYLNINIVNITSFTIINKNITFIAILMLSIFTNRSYVTTLRNT